MRRSSLEAVWLAEIHRETYVAILKSWIPHGERGNFAGKLGISQEYLSYLLALDHPAESRFPTRRLPSKKLSEKIAAALPAPSEVRHSFLENLELAHISSSKAYYSIRNHVSAHRVDELLHELEEIHRQATFGKDLLEVMRAYRALRDGSANLLHSLSPSSYPASYTQACLLLHDAQCVLDRADDAFRYARLAQLIMENTDIFESGFRKEEIHNFEINAIRGVAVAYHNLGLDREVPALLDRASSTPAYLQNGKFWKPIVGRDLLNSMVRIPRYSRREAKSIAHNIENISEQQDDAFTLLLIRESWLRCLLQEEKYKEAERLYQNELERIPHLPYVGSLHKALLYKSGALLSWKLGDKATWKQTIKETLHLMRQSGLKHQMRQVRELYGSVLTPIFDDLGWQNNRP